MGPDGGKTHVEVEHDGLRLQGWLELPEGEGPHPGAVLVAGSGDMSRDEWDEWPTWIGWAGVATLRYDKPGCGGSPGDWRAQSFEDRADEAVAALRALAAQPGVDPDRVGLLGASQGGWVAMLAGSRSDDLAFAIALSGPGVTPHEQEGYRIERCLRERGLPEDEIAEGMAYYHQHRGWMREGIAPAEILARQQQRSAEDWYQDVCGLLDSEEIIAFIANSLDVDPTAPLERLRCPFLALFGEDDDMVPVARSVEVMERTLASSPHSDYHVAVFPGGDHGLFVAEPQEGVPRHTQLAPGSLDLIADWLEERVGARPRREMTAQAGTAVTSPEP